MEALIRSAVHLSRQSARMLWYGGHGRLTGRVAARHAGSEPDTGRLPAAKPDRRAFRRALLALIRADLAHVASGVYPMPPALAEPLPAMARTMLAYYRDLPDTLSRRRRGGHSEVRDSAAPGYSRYYLQNFHFQSDGWLSDKSAAIYDHQVETLFGGAADMMRRQGLPPLVARFRGQRLPRPRLLDIGAGTGTFLRGLAAALPHARLHGLEPSPHYRARIARSVPRARLHGGFIEAMPFEDAVFDAASAVFLFHELPPKIRHAGMLEIVRILKPGGVFLLVDALQHGDDPALDPLLDLFPERFHEPYFGSWLDTDIVGLAEKAGLTLIETKPAFLSKVMLFGKC